MFGWDVTRVGCSSGCRFSVRAMLSRVPERVQQRNIPISLGSTKKQQHVDVKDLIKSSGWDGAHLSTCRARHANKHARTHGSTDRK